MAEKPARRPSPFARFLDYVLRLGADQITGLSLEDMALALAYSQSLDEAGSEGSSPVDAVAQRWRAGHETDAGATRGRRRQPILRGLVDAVQAHEVGKLNRPQLDLLVNVLDLMAGSHAPKHFERLAGLLEGEERAIRLRRDALPPVPGMTGLCPHIAVHTPADFEGGDERRLPGFGGTDTSVRGVLMDVPVALKFLGDVADGCYIETAGPAYVNGGVQGGLSCEEDVDLRHNAAGILISSHGTIRLRDILAGAQVIAKSGSVMCGTAHIPRLVFAGDTLSAEKATIMGSYKADVIEIAEQAFGGDFEVGTRMTVARLRHSENRPLTIVLRTGLTCEDYGESISGDARKLLAEAAELGQHLDNTRRMRALAREEAERLATSALLILCAGGGTRERIEEVELARRRLACLDRIIAGYNALGVAVENGIAARTRNIQDEQNEGDATVEASPVMDEIEEEIRQILAEQGMDEDLQAETEELGELDRTVRSRPELRVASHLYLSLRKKSQEWRERRKELVEVVRQNDAELGRMLKQLKIGRASGQGSVPRVELLEQVLTTMKPGRAGHALAARLSMASFRMLNRNVRIRVARQDSYRSNIETLRERLSAVEEQLRRDHNIQLRSRADSDGETPCVSSVQGRFDPGVRIAGNRVSLTLADVPKEMRVITPKGPEECTEYRRNMHNQIVKVS